MTLPPKQFVDIYRRRSENTKKLVEEAIALLKRRDESVTLGAIREAVLELSDGKHRLSQSTILRNPDALKLYQEASGPRRRPRARRMRAYLAELESNDEKSERSAIARLSRKTKADLIIELRKRIHEVERLQEELALLRSQHLDALIPLSIKVVERRR
ncbi:hypothetical protein [Sinimarinibacterium flocculans]|uniref:hypothetical protein n=1 Tax=Sinimarinibacterium flocculans TaxID=985250 RepID=UPI002493AFD9|nr:hypothetical protein [Sinimarinibacterium flocculans]